MSDAVCVGINGFGRVGRAVLVASLSNPAVRVTAINDPFVSAEYAAYLIKHEGGHAFRGTVSARKDSVVVDGNMIAVTQKSDPASIPWGDSRVVYVVECSGVHTTHDRAGAHLAGGASRVIITAPSTDAPTIVSGTNVESFKGTMQVIAAGSCTGMAVAPVLRMLHEAVGVEECTFTAIHAVTPSQKVVGGAVAKEWRAGRAALANIIPHSCGAMKTLQKSLPHLACKTVGTSLRVPVQNGCVLDMTVRFSQGTSKEALDGLIAAATAAGSKYANIISVSDEELVSEDVTGSPTVVYDSKASVSLSPTTHKLLFWYSHELGYAHRIIRLILETSATW